MQVSTGDKTNNASETADARLSSDAEERESPRRGFARWSRRYGKSVVQDFVHALREIEFGDRIMLFGAALLLSVLPLIILLGAMASQRIDDDIAGHLGLGSQNSGRTPSPDSATTSYTPVVFTTSRVYIPMPRAFASWTQPSGRFPRESEVASL
jgi:hypothetical protein